MANLFAPTPFFGRKKDMAFLHERIKQPGLTAVLARPQAGKSRLLQELRDKLRLGVQDDAPLVGYAQATRDTQSHILYAARDLNQHWLADASLTQQARKMIAARGEGVVARLGEAAAKSLAPFLKIIDPMGALSTLAPSIFTWLRGQDDALRTGGLDLPLLTPELARNLLNLLHEISGRRMVLILDAFDQLPDVRREGGPLREFLALMHEWPDCHVIVSSRMPGENEQEDAAYEELQSLNGAFGDTDAHLFSLPPMDFEDAQEAERVRIYLRDQVPAARGMPDKELMQILGGHPGTLDRFVREKPETRDELVATEHSARLYAYPEYERILTALRKDDVRLFGVAVQLALLPEMTGEERWRPLSAAIESQPNDLVDLHHKDVLQDFRYPTFGHTRKYEAVRETLRKHFIGDCATQAETLLRELAAQCTEGTTDELPFVLTIASFATNADKWRVGSEWTAFCQLTAAGLRRDGSDSDSGTVTQAIALAHREPACRALATMMLFNTLIDAKKENDLPRRDRILEELHTLQQTFPDDPAVRKQLAMGLFNTLVHAKEEDDLPRRDRLLEELRTLQQAFPDDPTVREWLAKGLFNTLHHAREEGNLPRCDDLLGELRALHKTFPDDEFVAKALDMATRLLNQDDDSEGDEAPAT
jgi:hypothetical protein